jgi:epoxyqueuosine reductase
VRSIVVAVMNYRTTEPAPPGPLEGRVSRYAWGDDYHQIMRDRLKALAEFIRAERPESRARAVVDTAPLLERDFARLAGIGWIGKNTMLINKRLGSWLFLGAVLTDAELEYDQPHSTEHCGTCTRCLDACPTQAFAGPYQLDSRRCISYLTIELRGPIPEQLRPAVGDWLFGCDVCQDVCPWNRKAPVCDEAGYAPRTPGGTVDLTRLATMSDAEMRESLRKSALARAGVRGLRRNAAVVLGNSGSLEAVLSLQKLADDADLFVREAAIWALDQIRRSQCVNIRRTPVVHE